MKRFLTAGVVVATSVLSWSLHPAAVHAGLQRPALTLVSQSSYVAGVEKSSFQMTLLVSPAIAEHVDASSSLVITSHRPVTNRDDVHDAVEGRLPQIIDAVTLTESDLRAAGSSGANGLRVDLTIRTEIGTRTDDALQMSATGIYPLTITWQQAGRTIVELVSFIERLPANSFGPEPEGVLDLALVGRLRAPVSLATDASTHISPGDRARVRDLVSIFEKRPDTPITLVAQPEFIDAFGRSTPEDQELLIRFQRSLPLGMLSDTYVNMDPTDADLHGLGRVFTRQLRLGETTLATLFPSRVAPRHTWVQSAPLSSGGARTLADLGFRLVVLPSEVQDAIARSTPSGSAFAGVDPSHIVELTFPDDGSIDGIVVDPRLSSALTRGSARPDGGEYLVAHQVLADLKALRLEMSARFANATPAIVLSTDSGDIPPAAMTDALIDVVTRDVRFAFIDLDTALASMSSARPSSIELSDLADQPVAFPASAYLGSLVDDLDATVDAYASVLPTGDEAPRRWRRLVDIVADNRLDGADRERYAASIRSEIAALAATIVPPTSTTFTLGGRQSPIRFSIRNDSTQDLQVVVRLRSSKLRIPDADRLVPLPAGTSTAVDVPVVARSNGQFPVTLQLLTPRGEMPLGPASTLTARVNALAGLGQLVTGIALLLLLSWWISHLRREYRRKQALTDLSSHRHPSGERPT